MDDTSLEPGIDIAGMATVFAVGVPIYLKLPATAGAFVMMGFMPHNLIRMCIPPFHPTAV